MRVPIDGCELDHAVAGFRVVELAANQVEHGEADRSKRDDPATESYERRAQRAPGLSLRLDEYVGLATGQAGELR